MADVAELRARLETLRLYRAQGTLSVRTADGRTVTYKSDAEQAAAIADLERQILAATGVPVRHVVVAASKGLES